MYFGPWRRTTRRRCRRGRRICTGAKLGRVVGLFSIPLAVPHVDELLRPARARRHDGDGVVVLVSGEGGVHLVRFCSTERERMVDSRLSGKFDGGEVGNGGGGDVEGSGSRWSRFQV